MGSDHSPLADDEQPPPLAWIHVRRRGRVWQPRNVNDNRPFSLVNFAAPRPRSQNPQARAHSRAGLQTDDVLPSCDSSRVRSPPIRCVSPRGSLDPSSHQAGKHSVDVPSSMVLDEQDVGPSVGHSVGSSATLNQNTSIFLEAGGLQPSSSMGPISGSVSGVSESTVSEQALGGGLSEARSRSPSHRRSASPKAAEVELLQRFQSTITDNDLPTPIVNFDEEELLSNLCKRKSKGKTTRFADDSLSASLKRPARQQGLKVKKKTSKKSVKFDDDVGDGLLSALLCNDITPAEIEARFSPVKG